MNTAKKRYRIKSEFRFTISVVITLFLMTFIVTSILGLNIATSLSKQHYIQVEVQAGDTLWTIAQKHMPDDMDPRKSVRIIEDVNQITAYSLQPGQVLDIPSEL